jgi:hypothetical protein
VSISLGTLVLPFPNRRLGKHKILKMSDESIARFSQLSVRFWAAYLSFYSLELILKWRESCRRTFVIDQLITDREKAGIKEKEELVAASVVTSCSLPLALHWSGEGFIADERVIGGLGLVAGLYQATVVWESF